MLEEKDFISLWSGSQDSNQVPFSSGPPAGQLGGEDTYNSSAHIIHLLLCVLPSGPRIGSFSFVHPSLPFFA